MTKPHTFHIPVMGTSYTIDTPIRVAHYGIDSVISIIDHSLTEKMRMHYAKKYDLDFELIPISDNDGRARRISAYLNLVKDIVDINFKNLKSSGFNSGSELSKYFEMLPDSPLKEKYRLMLKAGEHDKPRLQQDLLGLMSTGSIDVNIMTKIDGPSLDSNRTPKPIEFNEAPPLSYILRFHFFHFSDP